MDGLYSTTLLKWMISGYHYFQKHPCQLEMSVAPFRDPCWPDYFPNADLGTAVQQMGQRTWKEESQNNGQTIPTTEA